MEFILLLVAAYFASLVSGMAGFGGALLLLPFLTEIVGAVHAVPLLTIVQLIGNFSRVYFGFSQIQWKSVCLFLLSAIPFSILGALSFIELPKDLITRFIGAAILLFVGLKYIGAINLKANPLLLIGGGGLVGFLSGLIGSAGPLGAAIFLSLGLPPVAYIASEGITALAIHGVKLAVYQKYFTLSQDLWILAATMGLIVIVGTWSAKQVIQHISQNTFERYVAILLVIIALYMIIHGL
jgi:uncharacterized membrane protein YfcA